jgi:hypothetical protein
MLSFFVVFCFGIGLLATSLVKLSPQESNSEVKANNMPNVRLFCETAIISRKKKRANLIEMPFKVLPFAQKNSAKHIHQHRLDQRNLGLPQMRH